VRSRGGILIHGVDLTSPGKHAEVKAAENGSSHFCIRTRLPSPAIATFFSRAAPAKAIPFLQSAGVTSLEDTGIKIEGLSIYGSRWKPHICLGHPTPRAANLPTIGIRSPGGIDILVTQGPPHGILDQRIPPGIRRLAPWEGEKLSGGSDHLGCEERLAAVIRTKPRVYLFGRIQSCYGATKNEHTKFYNASLCDDAYDPIDEPWVIEISGSDL
jgi:hypothetical protein